MKPNLTKREVAIVKAVATGETVKSIASSLNRSPKTVAFHRVNIYKKLGFNSDALIALWAEAQGLATNPFSGLRGVP